MSGAPAPVEVRSARVVGGYALAAGLDEAARSELYASARDLPGVDGFEISVGAPTWPEDRAALHRAARRSAGPAAVVVTTIGLAAGLATGGMGIAAPDDEGRMAALRALRRANDQVRSLADRGHDIVAVQVHSYPTVDPSRSEDAGRSLQRSLIELASWDWCGAALVVEHCDARSAESAGSKGLLPLPVELRAVRSAAEESSTDIGVSLNTGRSAIEGRGAATVVEHVRAAQRTGLLRGVIVSGATERYSPYGPAWADVHPPLRDRLPASALTRTDVRAAFDEAVHPLRFDGAKVAPADAAAGIVERLTLLRTVVEALPGPR
ncbi:DUF4862 family protein [Arenivirga flava]|uniref:DUF4862 domain-containing protein n=1 Tax=Arenivirga flava TaxID=1930060 RepID=A0AA37UIZ1_9MICO|nr:DUF4862 family protein [Arenivirga flava]GMA28556.1 hypothetical protein GCM10025874_18090 [Arenivirga flava]